jgi:hypothetical protein
MNARQAPCSCCDSRAIDRRHFLHRTGQSALALGAAAYLSPLAHAADPTAGSVATDNKSPESLVKLLYESLSPGQREKICFPWEYKHADWGLLRTRVSANWQITDETINGDFYKPEQRELITAIFRGIISPEWHEKFETQQYDDGGGFGESNAIALFGTPGEGKSEFVITGRHMTLRCDGDAAEHVAFGGPIFYGHDPTGSGTDDPSHEGNVFWPQAAEANKLFEALDGKQRKLALVKNAPGESDVPFRGKDGKFDGIPVSELSSDQKERVQEVLQKLIEPYRQADRDEVVACLKAQGGIDECHLAFYQEGDLGKDKVWDIWRLEGPSFVWHWRGSPHVHVWVNVASDPSVKLNA